MSGADGQREDEKGSAGREMHGRCSRAQVFGDIGEGVHCVN